MPGQKRKKNVRRFLEALLIYTSPESQGVYEEHLEINFDWKESTDRFYRLVVRTRLKELEQLVPSDPEDGKLSRFQIREVLWDCLGDFLKILEDNREKTKGAENLHFTLMLWSKDKEENLLQFDQEWERRLLKLPSPNSCSQPKGDINWQQLCRTYLQLQRSLASNLFSAGMGISFDLDELHIPLELVERPQKSQRREDFPPELGSRVYQDEKTIPIDYDDFFDRVLARGQSPKSNGSRLAIIGEPGAGKTVLLLKVGEWVLNQAQALPIWISLGRVGQKPLDQYLTEDWLRMALGKAGLMSVPTKVACKFEQLLNQGQVWLLLDGADEMSVSDPLATLADQLRVPLLQNVRVVLTCRINLWDAPVNALSEFDTYRMLDFSFGEGNKPNQVKRFIDNWFSGSNSSSGSRLWQQLNQAGMTRIKDLARNPLRLGLLCLIWATGQKRLPKTKAKLYEFFVGALYELKQKVFPTTSPEYTALKAALGKLALEALILGYKSVLPSALVEKELDQAGLLEKALELGWLNRVGVEPENILKSVYAFFHPTFIEYFAASAIGDNWHFFLHHIQENPLDPSACYRIFEPQWLQVYLLWLGQENVAHSSKEALLQALIEFEDGCLGFYKKTAFLLVTVGIAELNNFSESRLMLVIFYQLLHWLKNEGCRYQGELFNIEQKPPSNRTLSDVFQIIRDVWHKNYKHKHIIQFLERKHLPRDIGLYDLIVLTMVFFTDNMLELEPGSPEKNRVDNAKVSSKFLEMPFTNGNQATTTAEDQVIRRTEPETQRLKPQDMISKELIDQFIEVMEQCIEKFKTIKDDQLICRAYAYIICSYCAQNMSYPDFYRAWHSDTLAAHDELLSSYTILITYIANRIPPDGSESREMGRIMISRWA